MKKLFSFIFVVLVLVSCKTTPPANGSATKLSEYFRYSPGKKTLISAHRGGKGYPGYPENCLETMEFIQKQIPNAIFEVDVASTSDGVLVLMHDNDLDRTSTGTGNIAATTMSSLSDIKLEDDQRNETGFGVPTFKEVLSWAKKEDAILMVDPKRSVGQLVILEEILASKALDHVVMITYSVDKAIELHQHTHNLMLSVSIRSQKEWERMQASRIPYSRMVAFTGTREPNAELIATLHKAGITCILGTLGNLDKRAAARGDHIYREFRVKGVDIFATDRPLEVQQALK